MLTAMAYGGRIGQDAPYMPRGCDMRWFTTDEICEILGRFDKVVLIGDSMLRHIIGSINILIRRDLGYGAVTDWNFSLQERSVHISIKCLFSRCIGKNVSVMSSSMSRLALFKEYTRRRMSSPMIQRV